MSFFYVCMLLLNFAFGQEFEDIQIEEPPAGETPSALEAESRTTKLATLIRCTICQGLSIEESTSTFAVKTRQRIHQLVQSGYTDEQIIAYFVDKYGEKALLKPLNKHWFVWFAPVGFVVLGLGIVYIRAKPKAKTASPSQSFTQPVKNDDTYRQQVLAELED